MKKKLLNNINYEVINTFLDRIHKGFLPKVSFETEQDRDLALLYLCDIMAGSMIYGKFIANKQLEWKLDRKGKIRLRKIKSKKYVNLLDYYNY